MGKKKRKRQLREQPVPVPETFDLSSTAKHVLTALFILAFLLGVFLRFYDLDRKPLHHDEGVNSWFLLNLKKGFEEGVPQNPPLDITPPWLEWTLPIAEKLDQLTAGSWNNGFNGWKYDPSNYHGPYLFLTHIIPLAIYESVFTLRVGLALFGSLFILLLWPLRRTIGRVGTVAAAFLIALSPTNLFFSRTNIHEIYLAFYTLAAYVSAIRLWETRKPRYLIYLAISSALVVTVKETYIMTTAAFFCSAVFTYVWLTKSRKKNELPPREFARGLFVLLKENRRFILIGIGVFVFIMIIFYSSLFTNWKGTTVDLINTILKWTKTGTEGEGHDKPVSYFGKLLWTFELPILIFGLLGIVYAFRRRNARMVFTAVWALFLFLIYSSVPYKTPWLALNFILPLALLAGFFIENLYRAVRGSSGMVAAVVAVGAAALFTWGASKSWSVNFINYDDDSYQLVYSQTRRDLDDLMDALVKYAHEQAQGYDTDIKIITDEYWPLQWYLKDYKHVGFWGSVIDEPDAPIVIGRTKTQDELEAALKDTYYSEMFSLRPGVDLIVYTRLHKGKRPEEELKGSDPVPLDTDDLEPGLQASYYPKINPVGKAKMVRVESKIDFYYNTDEEKPLKAPFSILWEGFIEITETGRYTFSTESDDGSWLFIDDKLVVDNGGTHGIQYKSDSIHLTEGLHRIKVKYFDSAWGAVMKLLWSSPGESEGPIPPKLLWHQD